MAEEQSGAPAPKSMHVVVDQAAVVQTVVEIMVPPGTTLEELERMAREAAALVPFDQKQVVPRPGDYQYVFPWDVSCY